MVAKKLHLRNMTCNHAQLLFVDPKKKAVALISLNTAPVYDLYLLDLRGNVGRMPVKRRDS